MSWQLWYQGWPVFIKTKGGPGSGHHGHAGRPGKHGGSAAGGGPATGMVGGQEYEYRTLPNGKRYELGPEEAAEILGLPDRDIETDAHISKVEWEWVSGGAADPHSIKEEIAGWYKSNPGVKDMRLLGQYNIDGKEGQSFEEWKDTPVTMWRGGHPEFGETFSSFSLRRGTAEGFAKRMGPGLYEAKVKPNDWVGITRGGEAEVFVPEFDRDWSPIPYKQVA